MIEAKSLTKRFGQKSAVQGVTFSVGPGEVLGFLGPNGAGKSTTMRMITGYIQPTSGTALIGGHDILDKPVAARKLLGYLPENAPVYPEMTVTGFLGFIAEIRGFSGAEKPRRVGAAIDRCFLSEVRHQTIGTLSKGYKQRVCFAQSLLHDPDYLIMDEPTDGLDPNQKHEVRGMIRAMAENKTIILSTHILEEVEALCTRVIIIDSGRIVVDDTPRGLRARSPVHGTVKLTFNSSLRPETLQAMESLPGVRGLEVQVNGDSSGVLLFPSDPLLPPVAAITSFLSDRDIQVRSFQVEEGRLDDVFRAVTTQKA